MQEKCNNDYSVQMTSNCRGHCTVESRVRKRDKKEKTDVI